MPIWADKVCRLFRFRFLTLFLCVTLVALWLGRATYIAKRQRQSLAVLSTQNLRILYDYQHEGRSQFSFEKQPPGPAWLRKVVGDDYFRRVVGVSTALGGPVNSEGVASLEKLPYLIEVRLTDSNLADSDLQYLKDLSKVTSLDLGGNQITDSGLEHLQGMRALEMMNLSENRIQGDGLRVLGGMPRLKKLFIYDAPLTDVGMSQVASAPNLEILGISRTHVTDEGIGHLSKLHKLEYLSANHNNISDASIEHLVTMNSLRDLELHGTKLSPSGIERLRKELPNCKVNGEGGGSRRSQFGPYGP